MNETFKNKYFYDISNTNTKNEDIFIKYQKLIIVATSLLSLYISIIFLSNENILFDKTYISNNYLQIKVDNWKLKEKTHFFIIYFLTMSIYFFIISILLYICKYSISINNLFSLKVYNCIILIRTFERIILNSIEQSIIFGSFIAYYIFNITTSNKEGVFCYKLLYFFIFGRCLFFCGYILNYYYKASFFRAPGVAFTIFPSILLLIKFSGHYNLNLFVNNYFFNNR